jgi:hypothetical protein
MFHSASSKCEVCGKAQSGCCLDDNFEQHKCDQLCVECRKAVGFAQEQRLRAYAAREHPGHPIQMLADGVNGEKIAWCGLCESILSAPIRKSEPAPRPEIEIPPFTSFTPPSVKSS